MSIDCANCGRQYDVTLFQFGRTISCACGARVGEAHRIELPASAELRFFADVMLHRLVRFLRALGFDTAWEDRIADAELVRRALCEHRWILTLDKRISEEWRVGNVLLLESEKLEEQLRQVAEFFQLEASGELFRRCLMCNAELRRAAQTEIKTHAPENIRAAQTDFRFCPQCEKIYWNGSHTDRMRNQIEKIFRRETS